ncbi:MAG: cbb3-type cytochrome oxidase assembly protein CcoS [Halothiobacillaceae bacterium]
MEVLYLFIPLSMLLVGGLVWLAFWAIRNNQFDDLEGPAHRILMDDDDPRIPTNARVVNRETESVKKSPPADDERSRE